MQEARLMKVLEQQHVLVVGKGHRHIIVVPEAAPLFFAEDVAIVCCRREPAPCSEPAVGFQPPRTPLQQHLRKRYHKQKPSELWYSMKCIPMHADRLGAQHPLPERCRDNA